MRTVLSTALAIMAAGLWSLVMIAAGVYSHRLYESRQRKLRIARLLADAKHTVNDAWLDNAALRQEATRKAQA